MSVETALIALGYIAAAAVLWVVGLFIAGMVMGFRDPEARNEARRRARR